jgi:transposase
MSQESKGTRRRFTDEFKQEAVALLLDGHQAKTVAERLGLGNVNLLYHWKRQQVSRAGTVASTLESRVQSLESELQRVTRERDILKKALAIFSRHE